MKTVAILKTKDESRIFKFERMDEPIIVCGTTYAYCETLIFDGVAVYQRLLEKSEINSELDMTSSDIYTYDRAHRDFNEG